jgi:perosamine synthetase
MMPAIAPATASAHALDRVPLVEPSLTGREWDYVRECLDTGWVSSVGAFVNRFEADVAAAAGARYGVATVNGTAALHLALRVAGVGPGDAVVVPALTFIAPVNAVRYMGAHPLFVDAEPDYWQMDVQQVRDCLLHRCRRESNRLYDRATGRRIAAVLPVHLLGHPVDLEHLVPLCRELGIAVIEDATESLGARHRGTAVGHLGDAACFSFNGNKLVTTGGGGMFVTDNEEWARRARHLSTQAKTDPVEYEHDEIGYNYRLTNVLAALGVAQMEQLHDKIAAKQAIAARYAAELASVPGITHMPEAPWASAVFWLYTVLVDEHRFGCDSRALMRLLAERGIQTRPLWQPIHQSPAYRDEAPVRLPVAERLHREALSLPCSVSLSSAAQMRVIDAIREVYRDVS